MTFFLVYGKSLQFACCFEDLECYVIGKTKIIKMIQGLKEINCKERSKKKWCSLYITGSFNLVLKTTHTVYMIHKSYTHISN